MSKAAKDIKAMDDKQLDVRLGELKLELIKSQGQVVSGGASSGVMPASNTKKTIARILTIKRERELQKAKGGNKQKT